MTEPVTAGTSPPAPVTRGATPGQPAGQPSVPQEQANVLAQAEESPAGASGLSAKEETTLADLQARALAARSGGMVRMKVEGPHESVTHAQVTIGREWTEVPASLASAIASAAADSGVTLTQES